MGFLVQQKQASSNEDWCDLEFARPNFSPNALLLITAIKNGGGYTDVQVTLEIDKFEVLCRAMMHVDHEAACAAFGIALGERFSNSTALWADEALPD